MSETLLYQKVLGLKAPWLVSKVQLDEEHQRIIVVVDYVHRGDSVCPVCQGLARQL